MCCVYGRLLFVYNKKKTKTSNPLITLTVKLLINWMEFFDLFLVNERSAFVRACVRARASSTTNCVRFVHNDMSICHGLVPMMNAN